ncbi:MAG TPA: hypothetical protein VN883_15425 [Myxococcales bacterium]|nr:hypothetical protein [Myxococcales bacterium]
MSLPLVPEGLPTEVPLVSPVVPELPLELGVDPLVVPVPLPLVEPLTPVPVLLSAPVAPALPASMPLALPLPLYWLLGLELEVEVLLPLAGPVWASAAPLAIQVATPRAAAVTIPNFLFAMLSLIAIV